MTREPDRYEEKARETLQMLSRSQWSEKDLIDAFAAALRQAAAEALNEVRQYVDASPMCSQRTMLRLLDDLASPAAAPAAEPSEPVAPARNVRDADSVSLLQWKARARSAEAKWRSHMAALLATIGGEVEGAPTADHNFLQRLRELTAKEKRIAELEAAIRWACGEEDEFQTRQPGQGAYWWRTELRRRAALADGGEGKT